MRRIFDFRDRFIGQAGNTALCLKNNITKMGLVVHNFTKHSQNVCLINIHILMYRHARYDCKLWNAFWFYNVFWALSYIINDHSCLNCCISTKLSLIICLISTHILTYRHARCHSKLWNASWFYSIFFEFFTQLTNIHVWSVIYSPNYYGLPV